MGAGFERLCWRLVGLGLGNERDVTLRGLDAVRSCAKVYLEAYTSVLGVDVDALERLYGKTGDDVRQTLRRGGVDARAGRATTTDVAFCVVGDAFAATTHSRFSVTRGRRGIEVRPVYNASIMNAVAGTGLSLYNFGAAISL